MAWDFQQCGLCDQQSLRSACAYVQSDQSLYQSFEYSTSVKLLTEHNLEFLSLRGGCTGSSESTQVKMPHCSKSHVTAQFCYHLQTNDTIGNHCTKCKSKLGCKDQESIQSSTTPDPGYQWESDKLTEDTTNESQEVSPFPAGDHKAHINRRAQRHSKHKTEQKHKRSTKEVPPWNGQ